MKKLHHFNTLILGVFLAITVTSSVAPSVAFGDAIESYPILEALQNSGKVLYSDTTDWMDKWRGMDLELTDTYRFPKISGSTSVNFKIKRFDEKGSTAMGLFLASNSSGNPTTELAYFNMSAILGWDAIFRPAARYELGPKAREEALELMKSTTLTEPQQIKNEQNIINLIATGNPLLGCVKAEKDSTNAAADVMADTHMGNNGGPNFSFPVIASLQIANSAPVKGQSVELIPGYVGDAYQLAQEYSVIMILDAVFQQGDRYSGGNVVIRKVGDEAHFYSTDNGGAYVREDSSSVTVQLPWFSRYDRKTIDGLREINQFLLNPEKGFLGYDDSANFVADLGLYFQLTPAQFAPLLQRNIQLVLDRVDSVVAQYGDSAYLD